MKTKLFVMVLFLAVIFYACAGEVPSKTAEKIQPKLTAFSFDESQILQLDNYAHLERAGTWFQGMGFMESSLRENFGDYAGAVTASFKEIAWAYGIGLIQKEDVERALLNVIINKGNETVFLAGNAVLEFAREQWDMAASSIASLQSGLDEPDSIENWMLLVCALEKNKNDRRASSSYQAIRGRYAFFPDYWYRGARFLPGYAAAEYAERCIDLSSDGPYADECRNILAAYIGLSSEDSLHIKTKNEIDKIISASHEKSDPYLLDALLPLAGLPDNPYTEYTVEVFKQLKTLPLYRDYFISRRAGASGRLSERLSLIIHS